MSTTWTVTLGYYAVFIIGVGSGRDADLPPAFTAWAANRFFVVLAVTGLSLPLRGPSSAATSASGTG